MYITMQIWGSIEESEATGLLQRPLRGGPQLGPFKGVQGSIRHIGIYMYIYACIVYGREYNMVYGISYGREYMVYGI